jgi:hypothetical protein
LKNSGLTGIAVIPYITRNYKIHCHEKTVDEMAVKIPGSSFTQKI